MNNQQPNWEQLIQNTSQNYNAQTPFQRETFRRDLAEGVANGIMSTMTYEQRMELARTRWKLLWQFFVVCVFLRCGAWVWEFVEPLWNCINEGLRTFVLASVGSLVVAVAVVAALWYGSVKIYKFFLGLLEGW